jgi:hypothetical protein
MLSYGIPGRLRANEALTVEDLKALQKDLSYLPRTMLAIRYREQWERCALLGGRIPGPPDDAGTHLPLENPMETAANRHNFQIVTGIAAFVNWMKGRTHFDLLR